MSNYGKRFLRFLRTVFCRIMPKRKQSMSTCQNSKADYNQDTREKSTPESHLHDVRPSEAEVSLQAAVVTAPESTSTEEVTATEQGDSVLSASADAEESTAEELACDAPEIAGEASFEEVTATEQDDSVLSASADAKESAAEDQTCDAPEIVNPEFHEEATAERDEVHENAAAEAHSNGDHRSSTTVEDQQSSLARERWTLLHGEPYQRWSLRRLAAMGIPGDYLKNVSMFEAIGDIPREEYPEEIANLNEPSWQQALSMCAGWEEILVQHRDALCIAQMQLAHIPDDKICQQLKVTESGLKTRMEVLRKAVIYWSVVHAQAIAFMRDGYKFREVPSKEFFGKTVAIIVQTLLPPPRIMTEQEKLERKLCEQVQHVPMLGDIELSTDEFEELMKACRSRYLRFMFSENQDRAKDIIMSIGLVQIAIREYQNHTFGRRSQNALALKKSR